MKSLKKLITYTIFIMSFLGIFLFNINAESNRLQKDDNYIIVKENIKKYYPNINLSDYDVKVTSVSNVHDVSPHTIYELTPKNFKMLDKENKKYKKFFVKWNKTSKFINSMDMFIENEKVKKFDVNKINKNNSKNISIKARTFLEDTKNSKVEFIGSYINKKPINNKAIPNITSIFRVKGKYYYEIEISYEDKVVRSVYVYDNYNDLQKHERENSYKKLY